VLVDRSKNLLQVADSFRFVPVTGPVLLAAVGTDAARLVGFDY
jgi:hypothetical protein